MNSTELFQLGRTLMRIGQKASPKSGLVKVQVKDSPDHQELVVSDAPDDAEDRRVVIDLPASVKLIVSDVFEHPDSSIGEITARTGFPQSHVSASVARLRDEGILVVTADPKDRRRTLVRVDFQHRAELVASGTIDDALAAALDTDDPSEVKEVVAMLEALAQRLLPNTSSGR
jgi:DNA-binding MarR family transcriptional regulator